MASRLDKMLRIEVRVDSAFFSDEIVMMLNGLNVEFTVSVPFERFPELKRMIEQRKRWKGIDETWSYFETNWKPKCWGQRQPDFSTVIFQRFYATSGSIRRKTDLCWPLMISRQMI